MVATAFDALNNTELALEGLQILAGDAGNARVRMGTLRAISLRLTTMRRQLGPQRGIFERIGEEIGQVDGLESDNERYFERIYEQLNRMVDGIDAAADSMAKLMDLRLNETMYWLTVVATIFLPLTFLTGFFGMNFAWLVGRIDTEVAFLVLGHRRLGRGHGADLVRGEAPRHPGAARPGRGRAGDRDAAAPAELSGRRGASTDGQGRPAIVVPRYKGILRAFPLRSFGSS